MKCKACGYQPIPDDAQFCPECGSGISEAKATTVQSSPTNYVDFQLRAWQADDSHIQVFVHSSPAGNMRRPLTVPFDAHLVDKAKKLSGILWANRNEKPKTNLLSTTKIGEALTNLLLPPPVSELLYQSLTLAAPDGLRIRLCLDEQLIDLPWEYLCRPDRSKTPSLSNFLILDARVSLVREAPRFVHNAGNPGERLTLVCAATPQWLDGNDIWFTKRESHRLQDALSEIEDIISFKPITSEGFRIERVLMERASIFQYIGHTDLEGSRGFLAREIQDGQIKARMDSTELAPLLQRAGTQLAVFTACNSGNWHFVKPLLDIGLQIYIGAQGVVSTAGAYAFTEKLYKSLAIGLSIDEAVTWARLHLLESEVLPLQGLFEWGAFMVYMPATNPVLFPRLTTATVRQRQQAVREQRQQTIINVTNNINQTIKAVKGGKVIGVNVDGTFAG